MPSRIGLKELHEFMETSEAEVDAEQMELFGQQKGGAEITPKMLEIVRILQSEPILCEPCLMWLRQTQARMAQAKLDVLFSAEEQAALRAKWGIE